MCGLCLFIQSLCYDLCDGGVPHMSMYMYIYQVTYESQSFVVLPEVMIIGVGLGICIHMGTHSWMSMGRVG